MATIVTRAGKGSPLTITEVDSNFTGLNTDKAELSGADFTGAITTNSTVDGRDVATDGTKLDGIEASADVTTASKIQTAGGLLDSELTSIASVKALDQGVATTDSPTFAAATVTGEITANGGIALGDNDKATFGAGDDLHIYHDGSNSYIDETATGHLFIRSNGDGIYLRSSTNEEIAHFNVNGSVKAYYDNSLKLATTSTGIDVTGTATMDGLTVKNPNVSGEQTILKIENAASTGTIGKITFNQTDDRMGISNEASGSLSFDTATVERLRIASNGDISFYEDTGSTAKLFWDASAESLGIGTSSANYKLNLLADAGAQNIFQAGQSGVSNGLSITSDGSALTYSFLTGNVGIGTSSPSAKLHLKDTTGSAVNLLRLETGWNNPSGNKSIVWTDSTNTLGRISLDYTAPKAKMRFGSLYNSGYQTGDVMTLTADGNVGIGTSSPATTLHITKDGNQSAVLDAYEAQQVSHNTIAYTRWVQNALGIANIMGVDSAAGILGTSSNHALAIRTNNTERMRINSDGKVDVGNVANQTVAVLNARFNGAAIEFGHGNNGAGYYGTAGSYGNNGQPYIGFSCYSQENVNVFTTNGAKGNIITGDLSGNLTFAQVTNASAVDQSPVNRMTLKSDGDFYWNNSPSSTAAGINFTNITHPSITVSGGADTAFRHRVVFVNGNGTVGVISTSGSATTYATSSDYRLKENVVLMSGSIDRLKALKPSRFNFIADPETTVDGFLAHEAQEVVAECATGTKDAMRDEEYEVTAAVEEVRDEDNNITTEAVEAVMGTRAVPDMQGIDQAKLVPLLVAALQEAIARIETLEAGV